jgi:chromosome segregation ATPase
MRSPILMAIIHPLNIIMAAMAVFAGLVSAWWLFPVGLLFWVVMVVGVARDQSLRINYEMQQRAPIAQRFQRYFTRIERSQVSVFNSLSSAPAKTRKVLQPVQDNINTLTQAAYALCQRMTALENYRVVSQSQTDLSTDLEHINEVIQSTEDPLVRREYEESRQALQERLAKLQSVSTQLERVEAQLMALANEMDGMVTELVRLQAAGPESAVAYVPDLMTRLRQEIARLKAFEMEATAVRNGSN